jgi:hypothetical protein
VSGANGNLLDYLDRGLIEAAYAAAPGNEIASGKFLSPESSAALAANAFGPFFARPALLPPIPGTGMASWPAVKVTPEAIVRFPWRGGRHPCLDALVETSDALIGIESKRYEPWRPKGKATLSGAYWREGAWGARMSGYQAIRDDLRRGDTDLRHLDAAQLVKHALGLRTAAARGGRKALLVYLFAEPDAWPDGRPVPAESIGRHRVEVASFAERVHADEVDFVALTSGELLSAWRKDPSERVRDHARALRDHFAGVIQRAGVVPEPLWRSDALPATPKG